MRIELEGLEAVRAALRALPAVLQQDVRVLAARHAHAYVAEVTAQVPVRTGTLRQRVVVEPLDSGVRVWWRAPHAILYERGTGPRVAYTRRGAARGQARGRHVIIPAAQRHRARFVADLAALVDREL